MRRGLSSCECSVVKPALERTDLLGDSWILAPSADQVRMKWDSAASDLARTRVVMQGFGLDRSVHPLLLSDQMLRLVVDARQSLRSVLRGWQARSWGCLNASFDALRFEVVLVVSPTEESLT
jgi:hypothetical protein